MKIELQGEVEIRASPEKVYNHLIDINSLGNIIPDLESYRATGPDSFEAKVRVGISFIRGSITLRGSIVEKMSSSFAKLQVEGTGLGSNLKLETSFTLEGRDGATNMKWRAISDASGLITGLGQKMIGIQANKMVNEIFAKLKETLEKTS